MTIDSRFRSRSFEVSWPHWIIKAELERLIKASDGPQHHVSNWSDECELFLTEAFTSTDPADEFRSLSERRSTWVDPFDESSPTSREDWLRDLSGALDVLPVPAPRLPYWSERRTGPKASSSTDLAATSRRFAWTIGKMIDSGYFAWAFGDSCVDGDYDGELGPDPAEEMHRELGRGDLWPVPYYSDGYSLDDLCDVIEYLADHVRRPLRRRYHDYAGCGWHFEAFSAERGAQIYRWRVNQILSQSVLGLTLAENGRLEMVAPSAVEDLVTAVRAAENVHDADDIELEHALAQFRARGASEMDRRQAVIALAGILERRRGLVKEQLLSKDEGALFQIANQFGIRHQDAKQQKEYNSELYLEWIFYWYVATINLTNRIVAAQP
ncbi:hypothetical protein P3T27_005902 [Kitasatospora sp. MAA19]|uniref:hypothetical protein n=1 Tax=unclassified Kitasatospora TaxID=2633591 RepID=UPI002473DE1A|nr:hypothetical protein [Kitasatospora sp. MAA19]MDH6709156.1 hypothetical protein [Kitasatospora sp. MAA19]